MRNLFLKKIFRKGFRKYRKFIIQKKKQNFLLLKEKFAKRRIINCIFKKLLINSIVNLNSSLLLVREVLFFKKRFLFLEYKDSCFSKLRFLIQKRIRLLKKRFRTKNQLDYKKFSIRKFKYLPKFCIISQSVSNIFVTLLDLNGEPFFTVSGGNFKIKKKRQIKSTATTIKLAESVLLALRKRRGFFLYLIISYPIKSFILRSFLHSIKKDRRLKIKYIVNLQKFAHNGCRFRKKRRN